MELPLLVCLSPLVLRRNLAIPARKHFLMASRIVLLFTFRSKPILKAAMPQQKPPYSLNRITVLILAIGISFLFYQLIHGFFIALVLAAIFAGLLYPVNDRICGWLGNRRSIGSMVTLILTILVVLIPFVGFVALLVEQAISITKSLAPLAENTVSGNVTDLEKDLDYLFGEFPMLENIFPDRDALIKRLRNIINSMGDFIVNGLSHITSGTVNFFLQAFIFLFALYYFLLNGKEYLKLGLYYLPLADAEERLLLGKFTTVTRATLKGTVIIGLIQGTIGAVAMALAGIPNTVFWGVVMVVLSAIPAVGPGIVLFPAGAYLIISGNVVAGIAIIATAILVVGTVDNLLRPILVGKDTKMPDLMVLLGTLGGLAVFGISGLILGPLIAALFITAWEIYSETFRSSLFTVTMFDAEPPRFKVAEEEIEAIREGDPEKLEELAKEDVAHKRKPKEQGRPDHDRPSD